MPTNASQGPDPDGEGSPRRPGGWAHDDDALTADPRFDDAFDDGGADGFASSEVDEDDSHRGAFGDFGGELGTGFLERSFRERIVIVGMTRDGQSAEDTEASLDELELLIDTAGADVVDRVVQRRDRPDPATFVGKGKVEEILDSALAYDADTIIFDDELSPAQQYNLERILKRTALDRTAVILDIFAQHATSLEGKTQVELAQLRYNLPRLRGRTFSQQGAGIGTRGPGETQLEVDRRRLLRRMHKLERDLKQIAQRRANQRKARRRSPYRTVSIVGYTNAGKSTLLNALTGADVKVEDRLFATLDPTTRQAKLAGGETILITDTVGFVKKLPHHLVEAFKSTLEVVLEVDLLVHVVDGSGPDPHGHIHAVRQVLTDIGALQIPELLVFNKADRAPEACAQLVRQHPGSVSVSAATGDGVDDVAAAIGDALREQSRMYDLFIPYSRGDMLAAVHREGEVMQEDAADDGVTIRARLEHASAKRLADFVRTVID